MLEVNMNDIVFTCFYEGKKEFGSPEPSKLCPAEGDHKLIGRYLFITILFPIMWIITKQERRGRYALTALLKRKIC